MLCYELLREWVRRSIRNQPLFKPRILVFILITLHKNNPFILKTYFTNWEVETLFVDSLLCHALGADLPVQNAKAYMIVDMGKFSTRIGIFSLSSLWTSKTIPVGGIHFDQAISLNYKSNIILQLETERWNI